MLPQIITNIYLLEKQLTIMGVFYYFFLQAPLSAQVEPKVQTVEFGRPATFTCTYRGNPVKSVTWLKDGIPLSKSLYVQYFSSLCRYYYIWLLKKIDF